VHSLVMMREDGMGRFKRVRACEGQWETRVPNKNIDMY
jgi:hypothetical protein